MARILVAEDSPAIRLLIRRRLEMAGHAVDEAENGLEALDRLRSTVAPDLLMLDENMPRTDGAGLLTWVREACPELPVIVVSARRESESAPEMADADARFTKPIDFELLLAAVDSLIVKRP